MTKPTKPAAVVGPTLDDAANPEVFNTKTFDWVEYTPLAVQFMEDSNDFCEAENDAAQSAASDASDDAAAALASANAAATSATNADASDVSANQHRLDALAAAALAGSEVLDLTGIAPGSVMIVGDNDEVTTTAPFGVRMHVYLHEFDATGDMIKPIGAFAFAPNLIGAGASGGVTTDDRAVGGGGGARVLEYIPAYNLPDVITVTIGAGGNSVTSGAGEDGGDTDFGGVLVAKGGRAGGANTSTVNTEFGKSGGGDNPGLIIQNSTTTIPASGSMDGGGGGGAHATDYALHGGNSKNGGPGGGAGTGSNGGTNEFGAIGGAGATAGNASDGVGAGAAGGTVFFTSGGPYSSGAGQDGAASVRTFCMVPKDTYQFRVDDPTGEMHTINLTTSNGTDIQIDWGDGSTSTATSGVGVTHTYAGPFKGYVTVEAQNTIVDVRFAGSDGHWAFPLSDLPDCATYFSLTNASSEIPGDLSELNRKTTYFLSSGPSEYTMKFDQWPLAKVDFDRLYLRTANMDQANVDRVLKAAESVTSFLSNFTNIDLLGNNAIPSAAGLASKAIIEGNGGTVAVNS